MAHDLKMPSDLEIIAQQEASLNRQDKIAGTAAAPSVTADESNVTDAGLSEFPTTNGIPQVSIGRTGQTGGGTNPQIIPPEEGGNGIAGESSAFFETAEGKYDLQHQLASSQPGKINLIGDDFRDRPTNRHEVIASNSKPEEPQLLETTANPFDINAPLQK